MKKTLNGQKKVGTIFYNLQSTDVTVRMQIIFCKINGVVKSLRLMGNGLWSETMPCGRRFLLSHRLNFLRVHQHLPLHCKKISAASLTYIGHDYGSRKDQST